MSELFILSDNICNRKQTHVFAFLYLTVLDLQRQTIYISLDNLIYLTPF